MRQSTCNLLQETRFKTETFSSLAEVVGSVWVAREVTSLRGSSKVRCARKCSELEGCWAFVRENDRCILIGHTTLPGNDVTEGHLETDGSIDVFGIPVLFFYPGV